MNIAREVGALLTFVRAALVIVLVPLLVGCGGDAAHPENDGGDHDGHGHDHAAPAVHKHDDPNETCFICDATKRDEGRLWCKGHERYEDRCWLCHPELKDKARLYCEEHGLYEDECHLCHPELKEQKAKTATDDRGKGNQDDHEGDAHANEGHGHAGHAHSADGLYCNEHDLPEIECAICQPDLATSLEPGESLKIRFASDDAADKVGVRTEHPTRADAAPRMKAICEVQYNLNALARVTPLGAGVIRKVFSDVGDKVEAGDVLAELHSVSAASAKSDFLAAIMEQAIRQQAFERESRLREQQIAAEKDFIAAEAAYRAAQLQVKTLHQKLANLGFTENEISEIERSQDTSAKLSIRAPFAGEIIERTAVAGEAVDMGDALFTVADLSTRWLTMSIPSSEIGRIRTGLSVEARFDALPATAFAGRIIWIDASIDPRSRLVRARALITEGTELLKTGLYGEATIFAARSQSGLHVPRDAVQHHEGLDYVFVRNEPDLFALRRVTLGGFDNDSAYILAGVAPQEDVVIEGSFIVMSEFLKSRLGAGCVHE